MCNAHIHLYRDSWKGSAQRIGAAICRSIDLVHGLDLDQNEVPEKKSLFDRCHDEMEPMKAWKGAKGKERKEARWTGWKSERIKKLERLRRVPTVTPLCPNCARCGSQLEGGAPTTGILERFLSNHLPNPTDPTGISIMLLSFGKLSER